MNAPIPKPRGKIVKRLLLAFASLLLVVILLAVFLPSILSTGWGNRQVLGILEGKLGTDVDASSLRFSWTGEQVIEGLRVASPPGSAKEADLARVSRATLRTGLLGLVFSGDRSIDLEVESPVITVVRDSEGRFNFDPLLGKEEKREEGPARPGGEGPREEKGLPQIQRPVSVIVKDGTVNYRDDGLDASSTLHALSIDLSLNPDGGRVQASGNVVQGASPPGSLLLAGTARGLRSSRSAMDLAIDAKGSVQGLDLRPYRAILARFFDVEPPPAPVSGSFVAATRDGALEVSSDLDGGGLALVKGATLRVPVRDASRPASLAVPLSVDLGQSLASLRSLSSLPDGSRVAGTLGGSIRASAPVTMVALLEKGTAAIRDLGVDVDLKARDLDVVVPRKVEGAAERQPEPLALQEKEMSLAARAIVGETIRIEKAELLGEGLRAELSGTVGPAGGGGDEAEGKARTLDLLASLDLAIPEALAHLAGSLPEGIDAAPGSKARLEGLSIGGRLVPGKPWSETLGGKGKFVIGGKVVYNGFSVEKADGDLRLEGGKVLVSALAAVNGGNIQAREVTYGLADRSYRIDVKTQGIEANYAMTPILAYVVPFLSPEARQADLSGKIEASLEIAGKGFEKADLAKTLAGKGGLRIGTGKLSASPFFDQLAGLVGASFGEILFQELGSDFSVGNGRIDCSMVFLVGGGGGKVRNLGLTGSTGIDGSLDYGVDIGVLEESIGDKKIRRVLQAARSVLKADALPLKLSGSLSQPRLALSPKVQNLDVEGLLERIPGLEKLPGLQVPGKKDGEKAEPSRKPEKKVKDLIEELLKKRK
jgi:hypothetical protein